MGIFKSLKDKLDKKKEEVEQKAMEKAAEMALKKTKDTAKNAIEGVSKKLENALFGDDEKSQANEDDDEAAESERPKPKKKSAAATDAGENRVADKKREKEQLERDYERFVKDREAAVAKKAAFEKEVDDDLAALKKRLGKK
jgi:hypothetical protein